MILKLFVAEEVVSEVAPQMPSWLRLAPLSDYVAATTGFLPVSESVSKLLPKMLLRLQLCATVESDPVEFQRLFDGASLHEVSPKMSSKS